MATVTAKWCVLSAALCVGAVAVPLAVPGGLPASIISSMAFAREFPGDSRQTLEDADSFVVYALDPNRFGRGINKFPPHLREGEAKKRAKAPPPEIFHEYTVLGKATLNGAEKRRLLDAFYDELKPRAGTQVRESASCFLPRHGVRAVNSKTGKAVDLLICYSCNNAFLYNNGEQFNFYAFGRASATCFHDLFVAHGLKAKH